MLLTPVWSRFGNGRTLPKDMPEETSRGGGGNIATSTPRRYSNRHVIPARHKVQRSGGFPVKKHRIAVKLFLLLFFSLVIAIAYNLRTSYKTRAHRAECGRANQEKLSALEPSVATINAEVQQM